MAVHVSLFLFSKPAHELDKEGEEIQASDVRELAAEIQFRLSRAADAIEKLTAGGWDASMMLYDVALSHPFINTESEARTHMSGLGLDPDDFCFMELDDEDEFDEDDLDDEFEDEDGGLLDDEEEAEEPREP